MSKWLNRILCPLDLDGDSPEELSVALALATENDAVVCLLYVAGEPVAEPPKPKPDWQRELEARLEKLAQRWFEGKVSYDVAVWSGDPAAAILQAVRDVNADLIVMATRRQGIDRLILGSVAERVIRESPVPVLTIRPKRI
jgi:nucleotide-binding universal stress UspA family protein